jgi:hypothetical protein
LDFTELVFEMQEVWLRPNRRVLALGMIAPAMFVILGVVLFFAGHASQSLMVEIIGSTFAVLGLTLIVIAAIFLRTPRLAYSPNELLVFLRVGPPYRLPISIVECVFMGKQSASLPGAGSVVPVQGLVIRIAEKATDFHNRHAKPALGRWADGYITIHGAWCEPLTVELVQRLNARLAEVQKIDASEV